MTIDPRTYPFRGELRTHQIKALTEAGLKPGHAWWCDPGAGKTALAISESSQLFTQGRIDGVLILAPNGPHIQWVDEQFPLWCDVVWRGVHNKMAPGAIKKFMEAKPLSRLGVATMNYDALRTDNGAAFINAFIKAHPRIYLVVDESQRCKSPTAQRTVEAIALAGRSAYRRVLSGTPILKGLEDLFTQYEIVQHGITGPFTRWTAYRNFYCKTAPVPGSRSPHARMIVGYQNEDLLMARTRPFATRITADEFMVGPTPDFMRVACPMVPEQAKAYRTMAEMLLADIEGKRITAQNALVQLGKLRQVASGFIIHDDGESFEWFGDNKINGALDIIEQLNEPVLCWAPFRALQMRMLAAVQQRNENPEDSFNVPIILYNDRADIERWKQQGGIMMGHQGSGLGVGQNLQHCAANIYLAPTFSSEDRWQSVKRTDRIGQTRQVRVWDLLAPGTVDVKAVKALMDKEDIARRNIDGLKDLIF
jgi:hypothetical protein